MIKIKDLRMETKPGLAKIVFTTTDVTEVDKVRAKHKDVPLQVEIKPIRSRRSKDANAYMWVLADQIADAINSTKEAVYRKAIKEVGVFSDVAVQKGKPLGDLLSSWSSNGIGWFAEVFDSGLSDSSGEAMKRVRLYKGSHLYDTKQMSRLIDYIVQEAKDLGIETTTPDELERMKTSWKGE